MPDRRTHILEGVNGAGRLLFRCGRSARRDVIGALYVGCALLKLRGNEVTCRMCQRISLVRPAAHGNKSQEK